MPPTPMNSASAEILHLEITKAAEHLKISLAVQRTGEMQTIRHVEEVSVSMDRISDRCRRMVETLNRANRRGNLSPDFLQKLKENGQHFRDELFSIGIKSQLNASAADQLILALDDQLVHIPWELLHDGKTFLCQRFAMGRVVRTRQTLANPDSRDLEPPMQMLIVADPCGDLKAAYTEGISLRDFMDEFESSPQVTFRSQGVNADLLKAKLRNYDLVHFAGHADYDDQNLENSSWRLSKGILTAADIVKMAGTGRMPALIFSNACQSARTEAWDAPSQMHQRVFGLANAFLLSGVRHYVGTFWEIPDVSSQRFAVAFYHYLLSGLTIGRAVQAARQALIECYGEENIIWASYLLYGDPSAVYMQNAAAEKAEAPPAVLPDDTPAPAAAAEIRAPEEIFHFTSEKASKSRKPVWFAAAALVLVLITAVALQWGGRGVQKNEQLALTAFKEGNYRQAAQACLRLQDRVPQRGLSYLLLGNIHFFKGELPRARDYYQHAIQAKRSSNMDKAEALIGLGRIASEKGRIDEALQFYRQAGDRWPNSQRPYVAQALLLEQQGEFNEAATILQKARSVSQNEMNLEGLAARLDTKLNRQADQQRQARIDQLIETLTRQITAAPETSPGPKWSSRPLTIWLMDMEKSGYSLQEGSAVLLTSALSEQMLRHPSIQVVERTVLDKVLEELKLSNTNLTDPEAMLALGRLASARLILLGRMVHQAPHSRVALRCIDTETGQVVAVVNMDFKAQDTLAAIATRITAQLTQKLKKAFPLKAKVVEISNGKLVLDIGRRQGAATGKTLKGDGVDLKAEIVTVHNNQSIARIQGDPTLATPGLRLEEAF